MPIPQDGRLPTPSEIHLYSIDSPPDRAEHKAVSTSRFRNFSRQIPNNSRFLSPHDTARKAASAPHLLHPNQCLARKPGKQFHSTTGPLYSSSLDASSEAFSTSASTGCHVKKASQPPRRIAPPAVIRFPGISTFRWFHGSSLEDDAPTAASPSPHATCWWSF